MTVSPAPSATASSTGDDRPWFTVLAIDGGGVRGLLPATILAELERAAEAAHGLRAVELFDLIVGTSTGGNIAMGLTCPDASGSGYRYTADGVRSVYTDPANSRRIFSPALPFLRSTGGRPLSQWWGLVTPKYSGRGIDAEMRRQFGDVRLGALRTNVVIASYDIARARPHLFRSWETGAYRDYRLADVARAISAAPLYFPPVTLGHVAPDGTPVTHTFVDGGVCMCDPVMIAYTEACALLQAQGRAPSSVRMLILSIGTGASPETYAPGRAGLLGWMGRGRLLSLLSDSVDQVADLEARLLYAPEGSVDYCRIQIPLVGEGYACASAMDDWTTENLGQLRRAGEVAARRHAAMLARVVEAGASRRRVRVRGAVAGTP